MKYFFYSRVSTIGQNLGRQFETFKQQPYFKSENLFFDKISGSVSFMQRPEAIRLFEKMTSCSTYKILVVDSIDRLGRNLMDVLSTLEIFNRNNICLKSLKEGFETLDSTGKENQLAKIVVSVMASISEMEKNRIKERVAEGITLARASGKYKGRKLGTVISDSQLLDKHPIIVKKLLMKRSIREIASITGKSLTTIMKVKKVLTKLHKI